MKPSSGKSHLLLSCGEPSTVVIDSCSSESNIKEVLLGITIDRNLKFDDQVNNFGKKACQKLNALSCFTLFMNKRRITIKIFIESPFGYYHLDVP